MDKEFAIMEQELLDKARSEIRAKMEAKPFEELEQDWMTTLNKMYGLDTVLKRVEEERAELGLETKAVAKAVYRSFSRSAIIFFEEFLKIDDERRAKG